MPFTVNRDLNVPNTGDLPGAWGTTAVNPNFVAIDGWMGGVASISLGAATTITLSVGAGSTFSPGAGPSQSDNALIKFSGTLTGNATVKFTMPGFYIVHNACLGAASFYIKLSPSSGGGNSIAAPPGRKCHVFFDGTDMDYVNAPEVGSALDLSQNTTGLPVWMTACSVSPYLIKNGAVYNASQYTTLAQYLGSTFGGNGVTTFGVPDEMARVRVGVDVTGANRLTAARCGVNGTLMGAAGGDEDMKAHSHGVNITDPGHTHDGGAANPNVFAFVQGGGNGITAVTSRTATDSATTGISIALVTTGAGTADNVQPCIVSCLPLIKT